MCNDILDVQSGNVPFMKGVDNAFNCKKSNAVCNDADVPDELCGELLPRSVCVFTLVDMITSRVGRGHNR